MTLNNKHFSGKMFLQKAVCMKAQSASVHSQSDRLANFKYNSVSTILLQIETFKTLRPAYSTLRSDPEF